MSNLSNLSDDHTPNGRFRKGNNAARGRNPKKSSAQKALHKLYKATDGSEMDRIITNLLSMADGTKEDVKASDQLAAIKLIMDRVMGKPVQQVDVNKTVTTSHERLVIVKEALGMGKNPLPAPDDVIAAEWELRQEEDEEI